MFTPTACTVKGLCPEWVSLAFLPQPRAQAWSGVNDSGGRLSSETPLPGSPILRFKSGHPVSLLSGAKFSSTTSQWLSENRAKLMRGAGEKERERGKRKGRKE